MSPTWGHSILALAIPRGSSAPDSSTLVWGAWPLAAPGLHGVQMGTLTKVTDWSPDLEPWAGCKAKALLAGWAVWWEPPERDNRTLLAGTVQGKEGLWKCRYHVQVEIWAWRKAQPSSLSQLGRIPGYIGICSFVRYGQPHPLPRSQSLLCPAHPLAPLAPPDKPPGKRLLAGCEHEELLIAFCQMASPCMEPGTQPGTYRWSL